MGEGQEEEQDVLSGKGTTASFPRPPWRQTRPAQPGAASEARWDQGGVGVPGATMRGRSRERLTTVSTAAHHLISRNLAPRSGQ